MADLKPGSAGYQSSRAVFDVLIGEDVARLLFEASSSGDNITQRSMLLQPQWTKIALEKPHCIYFQERPSHDKSHVRGVLAMKMSNLERAIIKAAENGHAAAVSVLLSFASQQGLEPSSVITRWAVDRTINNGHAAIFKVLAAADPTIVISPLLGHGTLPLDQAVKRSQTEVVAVLLQLGADPIPSASSLKNVGSYRSSLLSLATKAEGTRMTELLLKHGVSVARSGALHLAAELGALLQFFDILIFFHAALYIKTTGIGFSKKYISMR
ncbi:hypothetical protein B0O99DRAFT_688397 [Bisporella sp. PMI_857]|nr:hypothetical protein B0O99DRAFT_688397 [Bisporella sp. PMI_857]